ncbi:transporter [Geomonas sp. RF6]|uniref:transporter n=1 Tax=Geomonas sp. RF6 TaxID=2897342 RepID=UPI001E537351|nr:transporter [Geomonas sp. RF6]UFS70780.1 transporter [Geomonas sp. RF6]
MKKILVALMLCTGLALPDLSFAANARDYIPAPPGTFLFCSYFKHITAHKLYSDGNRVSSDFNLSENIGIFRPVYYTSIAPKALYGNGPFTIDPQSLVVFGDAELDGSATGQTNLSDSGFADPVLLTTFWFVNAPEDKLWVGFTPYVTMPLGSYDRTRGLNLGANRWVIRPEIGIVKGIGDRAYVDLVFNGDFFTDNDDYGTGADRGKLEQDPLFGFETHASYDITKQWFVSLDYYYNRGGETKVNGVKQNDEQENHGLGLSFFWGVGDHNQLMIEYRDDFSVKSGPGTNTFTARWAYFF